VNFGAPLMLVGLALLPLALAAYVVAQRRRRRYAVRYTNVDLLASVAGRVGWTRHVPALLALLALAALLVALGRPERTVAAEQRAATVVMVTDTSGSMFAKDIAPDRLTAAKNAGHALANKLPRDFRLGLISFGTEVAQLVEPTTDKQRVKVAVESLKFGGYTAMGEGLDAGIDAARTRVTDPDTGLPRRLPAAIVLLSDGANTRGRDPITIADRAKQLKIPVYTVALGTRDATVPNPGFGPPLLSVPPDPELLKRVADASGGRSFSAQDDQQLSSIYKTLGSQLGTRDVHREVTAAFAVGGLILLLGAAAASTRWAGRLP